MIPPASGIGRITARASGTARHRLPLELSAGLATIAIAILILVSGRLLLIGAGDLAIAGLFSTDEELAGELVRAMVRSGNLGLSHFFSYGPLALYAARALLWPYSILRPVSDESILVALRLVSILGGCAALITTYALGRLLWDGWTGAIAAILLAMGATMLAWSTTAHPDALQLAFLQLGLLLTVLLVRRASLPAVCGASACAGLAFATKYSGVFLLPVIWIGFAIGQIARDGGSLIDLRPRTLLACAQALALSLAVFGAVFLLVDPSVLVEARSFVSQVRLESELARHGHLYSTGPSMVAWLRQLGAAEVLGPLVLALALTALAFFTFVDLRTLGRRFLHSSQPRPGDPRIGPPEESAAVSRAARRLPIEIWTEGDLLVLFGWIGDVQARYALPVLPELTLFAVAGGIWLVRRLPLHAPAAAVLLVLTLAPLALASLTYVQTQSRRMHTAGVADRLAAGRWMAEHVDARAPILHDAYAYIPPAFTNTQETFGLSGEQIEAYRPRIIVTDDSIHARFEDPTTAARYQGGAAAFSKIAATYTALSSGILPCYPHLARFGPVDIYGLAAPTSQVAGC